MLQNIGISYNVKNLKVKQKGIGDLKGLFGCIFVCRIGIGLSVGEINLPQNAKIGKTLEDKQLQEVLQKAVAKKHSKGNESRKLHIASKGENQSLKAQSMK